ncbi:MAG: hypothetical protein AMXMBFR7_38420 [Planctomycetota bacterium]
MLRRGMSPGIPLAGLLAVLVAVAAHAPARAQGAAAKQEKTVAELVSIAKKRTGYPEDRLDAVRSLSSLRDRDKVNENDVVDALLWVVQQKDDDLFVRIGCIKALGQLQGNLFTLDRLAAKKYTEVFTKHLTDDKEETHIRAEICRVFGATLVLSSLPEERALEALQKIASEEGRQAGNMPDLLIRETAVRAIGQVGNGACLDTLANILIQVNLDNRLKEAVLSAFYALLSRIDKDLDKLVTPPTVNRLIQLVEEKAMDAEIRAEGMKALARLEANGVRTGNRVLPVIEKILKEESKPVLLIAAVEALGVTGKDEALPALIKAFEDMYNADSASGSYANDLKIRQTIAKTLGYMLAAQRVRKPAPVADSVAKMAKLLLDIVDPQAQKKEVKEVIRSAIFSLRYLYPMQTPFKEFHKDALEKLLYHLRKDEDKEGRAVLLESIEYISRQNFGDDVVRWDKWFDEAYPGMRVKK